MFKVVDKTLSAALAASGTTTFSYPAGTDEDSFAGFGHVAIAIGNVMTSPTDFTLTFGSASITFTYAASKTTIPAGSVVSLQLNLPGEDDRTPTATVDQPGVSMLGLVRVDLGSPLTLDVDGIAAAQAVAGAGNLTLNGALASGGAVDLVSGAGGSPFGRGVEIDSSGAGDTTQTATVTGTDYLGNAMSEVIAFNGTTAVAGKKAFATVTQVAISAALAGNATCGTTDVLGLPFYLGTVDAPVIELADNATATAGTTVGGVDAAATTTTGDVRGTYDPNSACNGAINFALYLAVSDPTYLGVTQA